MKQFKASSAIIIITILALVVVGGGVWYFVDKSDETADWKTYTNTKYGYELKYPSDWYVDTTFSNSDLEVKSPVNNIPYGGETYFSNYSQASNYSPYSGPGIPAPKGSLVVSLNVSRVDQNIDYDEFIPGYDNMTKEDININGIGAVKILVKNFSVEDSKFEFKNVYIKIDDKMFNLEYHGYPISEQMENIASKIINSFKAKLIDDETANWKTYTNEEYGFEVKYPNDMSVIVNVSEIYGEDKPFLYLNVGEEDYIKNLYREGGPGLLPDSIDNAGFRISAYKIALHGLKPLDKAENFKISKIIIDGVEANIYNGEYDLPEGKIPALYGEFINKNNSIKYTLNSSFYSAEDKILINQILSTFKFID